jgi:hypothetical protein
MAYYFPRPEAQTLVILLLLGAVVLVATVLASTLYIGWGTRSTATLTSILPSLRH